LLLAILAGSHGDKKEHQRIKALFSLKMEAKTSGSIFDGANVSAVDCE
jgi:hypothetical protein